MPYNEDIYIRIKKVLIVNDIAFVDKKMFGGIAFMLEDKMCFGVINNQIMLRVLDKHYEILLETNHYNPMNFTGKTMKDFLFVDEEAFQNNVSLHKVLEYGIEFSKKGVLKAKKRK